MTSWSIKKSNFIVGPFLNLFLDLFWTYFWPILGSKLDFLLLLVSIRIRITDVLAYLILPSDSFGYLRFKYYIWIYSLDNFGLVLSQFGLRRTKNCITNKFKNAECSKMIFYAWSSNFWIIWTFSNILGAHYIKKSVLVLNFFFTQSIIVQWNFFDYDRVPVNYLLQ